MQYYAPTAPLLVVSLLPIASAIKCYQCSTSEDPKGKDLCGAYRYFDTSKNTPVDCLGEQAVALGTFCYKRLQQSPRGFIWDGRWRSVERRCAQVSERGINWGCDWGYDLQGVYWEECYCAEDGCNGSPTLMSTARILFSLCLLPLLWLAIQPM
ncbi:uncharacterized protein LOC111260968 [Varroa jacobsoni]|uniref:Protein sleepless n=1 Tax=Varroa destructor TaxID=109461 RepID=A0A7M7IYS0_VARDE|nr:uncharacterized protein LOC111243325 [Varroa destructor]XP_022689830.1 uncharacterized protein LOC111260968 [Varroa jacobsoni]